MNRNALLRSWYYYAIAAGAMTISSTRGLYAQPAVQYSEAPLSTISGTILNETGQALHGTLSALQVISIAGRTVLQERCSARLTPSGEYTCGGLPAGQYYLVAHPSTSPPANSSKDPIAAGMEYPAFVIYPNAADMNQALPVFVGWKTREVCDFTVLTQFVSQVSGTVRGSPKTPDFALFSRAAGLKMNTDVRVSYARKTGVFVIRAIPNGEYLLRAVWTLDGVRQEADYPLSVLGEDTLDLNLVPQEAGEISGTVSLPDPQTSVPHEVLLQGVDMDTMDRVALVRSDGSFLFRQVRPGRYIVEVTPSNTEYVASVSVNGQSSAIPVITAISGQSPMTISIELGTDGGAIQGVVEDDDARSPGGIVIQSFESGQTRTVASDQSGAFAVTGLAPGRYRLYAWRHLTSISYRNPQFLQEYGEEAETITVGAGETATGVTVHLVDAQ